MRTAVVGGGLAGLAAALELVDAGHEVTLYEARPTLGGAVQTLPERAGDPAPPPDNGQHIALGACEEYLSFLRRIGREGDLRREPLALPVLDERGRVAIIRPGLASLLRYRHVSLGDRLRILRLLARPPAGAGEGTFADSLRAQGQSDAAIERFWDVFMRPALNLRSDEADAGIGWFTVRTALLGERSAGDLLLPAAPLGEMHGEAAGRALEAAGAVIRTGARVDSLDELEADVVVVAVPPAESARLLGEPELELDDSPIVSVHLLFERPILPYRLAALLGSPAHWVFDRGALTGVPKDAFPKARPERARPSPRGRPGSALRAGRPVTVPRASQYLTVVSSGAPELMDVRGKALVELMAGELTARLGPAKLLWSRVSREPAATIALRPGVRRPAPGLVRDGIARAGAWTDTGWPVTMEAAIRSGRAAARALQGVREEVHA